MDVRRFISGVDGSSVTTAALEAATDKMPVINGVGNAKRLRHHTPNTLGTKTDYERFLGIEKVVVATTGTWTATRGAQALPVLRHTAADNTSILVIDITEELRTAASKGLQLATFDVLFENATADLDAHTVTLDTVLYADSVAEAVTSIAITGALGVGQDADTQIDAVTITTPAYWRNAAVDKAVIEITVNAAATSAYDFVGIKLKYTRNTL